MGEVLRDEFLQVTNGFGKRLGKNETDCAAMQVNIQNNKEDISELKITVKESTEEFTKQANKISRSVIIGAVLLGLSLVVKEIVLK